MRAEKLIKSFSLSHMWLFPNSKAVAWLRLAGAQGRRAERNPVAILQSVL